MYPVSNDFKIAALKSEREFQAKIVIGGTKVFEDSSIVGFSIADSLTSKDDFTIGEAISSKLTASIRTKIPLLDGEKVEPFIRIKLNEGYSDYMPLGVFSIDSKVNKNNIWEITAYDDLTALLIPYESELLYPATMLAVMNEIKAQLNLTFDSSIVINPTFTIAYNNNTDPPTIRDVIRWIAGAHLCSARMTKDGKLGWVKFSPAVTTRTGIQMSSCFRVNKINDIRTITKVIVTDSSQGETVYIERGSGDAYHTLTFDNPYVTQAYLNALFPQIEGFSYVPYELSCRGLPYLETGDAITFQRDESLTWLDIDIPWQDYNVPWDGLVTYNSLILHSELVYKKGLLQNIAARTRSEKENEYEFTGTLNAEIQRLRRNAIQESKLYNGVKITRASGVEVIRSDGKAEVSMNATDGFRIQSDRGDGYLEDALYIDTNGNLKIHGDSIISFGDIYDVPDFVTDSDLQDELLNYVTGSGLTTILGQDYVITGKILANQIAAGTISGVTIDVDTDMTVGNNIYLGGSSGIRLENDEGYFYLRRSGVRAMKFWSNGIFVEGNVDVSRGGSIGMHDGINGTTREAMITFHTDGGISIRGTGADMNIGTSGYNPTVNIYGYMRHRGDRIGFFGYSASSRTSVSSPNSIVTTQTASGSYGSNEQNMLNNLKQDVRNLRSTLYDLRDALNSYGLV